MNRNQLKYFVAAAESRSFTKAAEQFYISQTAITQQIRLLEETLGCPLFDRSTRPVSLTSAGTIFLREAKGILERMSRAQERVHDASTGLSGTLRVGYVRGYERSDLSAHIRQFHQQNSNVLITFYRCSTDALATGLLHHEYDIIFTWDSTTLKTQEGVSCRTVEKARLVVALYAGHPLAQRQQLRRQRREERELHAEQREDRRDAHRAGPAVAHDLELPLPRTARQETVGRIGQSIEMQSLGQRLRQQREKHCRRQRRAISGETPADPVKERPEEKPGGREQIQRPPQLRFGRTESPERQCAQHRDGGEKSPHFSPSSVTRADSKVAISFMIADAASSRFSASAAPVPSPSRMPRSSSGCLPSSFAITT